MREIITVKGVGPVLAKSCADRGFRNAKDIASATVSDLKIVPGISEARARQLIEAAKSALKDTAPPETASPTKDKSPPKKKKNKKKNKKGNKKDKKMKIKIEKKIKNKKKKKKNKNKKTKKHERKSGKKN